MAGKFKMPSIKDVEQEESKDTAVKEKFKVGAGLLSDVSKGSVVMKITNIPREQIEKNPNNKYSISGIPSLAESIKTYGLGEPLNVVATENGTYKLLGGERRLTAIDMLIADETVTEWNETTLLPCVVKNLDDIKLDLSQENKERYAIITTNKEQRTYSDGDTYMELQEWKKIVEELRSKGIEYIDGVDEDGNEKPIAIKGEKTRDILSRTTGISRGQVNKFETVHNKGSEKLKDALLGGKISVSTAAKAAKKLPDAEQDAIAEAAEQGKEITGADVEDRVRERLNVTPAMFRKDIENIFTAIKEKEISLDGHEQEKYHFHINQLEHLFRGHK